MGGTLIGVFLLGALTAEDDTVVVVEEIVPDDEETTPGSV